MSEQRLPDLEQRKLIDSGLDTCMLVEAAAGTGKTTKIIDRMTALIREGRCRAGAMAAITFTRKAAAEMRSRFQTRLEALARETDGIGGERLRHAAEHAGECYIGTIHSFCARLLRERPVEAGVPLDFSQIEEDEDGRLRMEAWDNYCNTLYAEENPILSRMAELGMSIGDLRESFAAFADYPDVERWPVEPQGPLPDAAPLLAALGEYLRHVENNVLPLIDETGSDNLLKLYRKLPFLFAGADRDNISSIIRVLMKFDRDKPPGTVQKYWPGSCRDEKKAGIAAETQRWTQFRDSHARPYLRRIYQQRYAAAMEAFSGAREEYDRLRAARKQLNFQDLLMRSAALLREGGTALRRYFSARFSHLLIDEFQDTDPVQAEVMFLLAADDPEEKDWRRCIPRPGSLFIVGDPKQSIYRFRRADLVTYGEVRKIISGSGGEVIQLSSNFRSVKPLLDWINASFEDRFPEQPDDYAPAYVHLRTGKETCGADPSSCVLRLTAPDELSSSSRELIVENEAENIAAYIDHALKTGTTIRSVRADGEERQVRPGDFMIVTWTRANMSIYARKLDQLGIPNAVTGGTVLNEVPQIRQLHSYMAALVHPHNPVALAAALRGELFGIDDRALYDFVRNGGQFDWRCDVPEGLPDALRSKIESVFRHFRRSRSLIAGLPPTSAIQRIAEELGLMVMAAASAGGNVQAGSMGKAVELLRSAGPQFWSVSEMVDYLGEIAASQEKHDGLPARPFREEPLRIMNLHKVKGLQAPIVFLADPGGASERAPLFHIDRRTPGGARGFLNLRKKTGPFSSEPLARPAGWEDRWAPTEAKFINAEVQRLLYVAATRAENRLIISQRTKRENSNPWTPFKENLSECAEFAAGASFQPPETLKETADQTAAGEPVSEPERPEGRRRALLTPGYHMRRARPRVAAPDLLPGREYGMEWGALLHRLLETRMQRQEADLRPLAASIVGEQGLPESFIDEAIHAVKSLTEKPSGIFERARHAIHRQTETPFTCRMDDEDGKPVLLSGTVDLAFLEEDGWVIVDYKTDAAAADPAARERLTEAYSTQLENYVEAWRRCTGESVKESGIYYTAAPAYVRLT